MEGVWILLMECWFTMFIGHPNRIKFYHGSIFTSKKRKTFCSSTEIEIRLSGICFHCSLGIGKRLHESLHRIFNAVNLDFPTINNKILFQFAVKVLKDTVRENGLISSGVVLEIVPRLPINSIDFSTQKEQMKAFSKALMRVNAIISERKISTALGK